MVPSISFFTSIVLLKYPVEPLLSELSLSVFSIIRISVENYATFTSNSGTDQKMKRKSYTTCTSFTCSFKTLTNLENVIFTIVPMKNKIV